jgi:hypothetical protein
MRLSGNAMPFLELPDLRPQLRAGQIDDHAAGLATRGGTRLEGRRDRFPLARRLVRAIDPQQVGSRLDHLIGPGGSDLRGVGRGHHDVHVPSRRTRSEQHPGVLDVLQPHARPSHGVT